MHSVPSVAVRMTRAHRGQATVFLLGFAAALAGAFLLAFNAGQLVANQQRLLNAADAAAFGGAVWQARSLNFQAYANRAIVANEVAIAQSVGLRSWSDYMGRTLDNVDSVARYVPYLGQATTALRRSWRGVDAVLQPTALGAESAAIMVNAILAESQPVVHALGQVAAEQVARDTLAAYGAGTQASGAGAALAAANLLAWEGFTETRTGARRARLRDVVVAGRDGFTRDRGALFAPVPANLVVRLEKRGGTDLIGLDAWRSLDTLAMHRRSGLIFGSFRESVPIGWGGAEQARYAPRQRGEHGGAWRTNPRTARLAEQRIVQRSGARGTSYPGLPATRDLADPARPDERVLRFVVEAMRPARHVPTADVALGVTALAGPREDASLHGPGPGHGGAHYALGAADVRFARPQGRADGRREYPSLYSPYWQARLARPTPRDRSIAAATKRVVDPYAGLAP